MCLKSLQLVSITLASVVFFASQTILRQATKFVKIKRFVVGPGERYQKSYEPGLTYINVNFSSLNETTIVHKKSKAILPL